MSEPIKAGDLVVVVHDCCGHWLGKVFTVRNVGRESDLLECGVCAFKSENYSDLAFNAHWSRKGQVWCAPTSWLKRIPPLSELEGEKHKEELTA
jgi:hypothetical protein